MIYRLLDTMTAYQIARFYTDYLEENPDEEDHCGIYVEDGLRFRCSYDIEGELADRWKGYFAPLWGGF